LRIPIETKLLPIDTTLKHPSDDQDTPVLIIPITHSNLDQLTEDQQEVIEEDNNTIVEVPTIHIQAIEVKYLPNKDNITVPATGTFTSLNDNPEKDKIIVTPIEEHTEESDVDNVLTTVGERKSSTTTNVSRTNLNRHSNNLDEVSLGIAKTVYTSKPSVTHNLPPQSLNEIAIGSKILAIPLVKEKNRSIAVEPTLNMSLFKSAVEAKERYSFEVVEDSSAQELTTLRPDPLFDSDPTLNNTDLEQLDNMSKETNTLPDQENLPPSHSTFVVMPNELMSPAIAGKELTPPNVIKISDSGMLHRLYEAVLETKETLQFNESKTLTVMLKPEELGVVHVELHSDKSGKIHAVLSVEKPETFNLFQQDMNQLKTVLKDVDIEESSLSLQLTTDSNTGHQHHPKYEEWETRERMLMRDIKQQEAPMAENSTYSTKRHSHRRLDIKV
jgi:flagellar hook-length control protein FliK